MAEGDEVATRKAETDSENKFKSKYFWFLIFSSNKKFHG
jgi:hypothetical protein